MTFAKMLFFFLLMLTVVGQSQTEFGLNSAGLKLGYIKPDNMDNTVGFGLVADVGKIDMFSINAYLDYWAKSYTEEMYWDWQWSVVSLAVLGTYDFELQSPFKPYLGAGIGFDISTWKSEYNNPLAGSDLLIDEKSSESDFDLAVHLLGGARYALTPQVEGFIEIKYTTGGIDYFGAYAGVRYTLKNN